MLFGFPSYTSPIVLPIWPRFVYLIAGLCSFYMALVPLLSGGHASTLFIGFWIGAALLLMAAIFPRSSKYSIDSTIRDSYRVVSPANVFALFGSTVTTVLLLYGITRFVAFRLGYTHGKVQIGAYQPNAFDRVNQMLTTPVLVTLLISSVASLLISALILFRTPRKLSAFRPQ